jgi:hypothetical protein
MDRQTMSHIVGRLAAPGALYGEVTDTLFVSSFNVSFFF